MKEGVYSVGSTKPEPGVGGLDHGKNDMEIRMDRIEP